MNEEFALLNDSDELFFAFPSGSGSTAIVNDGTLYTGTFNGFFAIDINNPSSITKYDATETAVLPFNKVNDFEIADDGMIWLAQQASDNNSGGVTKFDIVNGTYEVYTQENPGSSVVDILPQAIALNPNGTVHISASNYGAVADIDFSTGTDSWEFIELNDFTTFGVPVTYIPDEIYFVNGKTYYITNDFSSGVSTNYEVVIRDGNVWTGRNDNAPGNISYWMIRRFRGAHPTLEGGTLWVNDFDDIIVRSDENSVFTPTISFELSGSQGAIDQDDQYVSNLREGSTSFEVQKITTPALYEYPTENNGGDRNVAQYNDQIWVYNQDAGTIEIYIDDTIVQTYNLDPSVSLSSYFRAAVDSNGIFWSLKTVNGGIASLLRFDRATEDLTEIVLSSDFSATRSIQPAPDGGIWLLGNSDVIFYKDGLEYTFADDLPGFLSFVDGVVDTNGKIHFLTTGAADLVTIENPTTADPIIETTKLVGSTGLLPTENTTTARDIVLDTDGDVWVNSNKGFYKIIDDDTTAFYRTDGTTTGIISGRLYVDFNDSGSYDEGEGVSGQSLAINVNGTVKNVVSGERGVYRFFAQEENTQHKIVLTSLDNEYYSLDRILDVDVANLDQDYEGNDFILEVKEYNSLIFKTGDRMGLWGFDREGFDNVFTTAVSNRSATKTFNELEVSYIFENEDGGDLPDILNVKFTKLDPDGFELLHSYISINPKSNFWKITGRSPSTYTQEMVAVPYEVTEETGKTRVTFTIPAILPRDTWVIEIQTDLFNPQLAGTGVSFAVESVGSPDFENPPLSGDPFILYPDDLRDYDEVPLPSEDPNSPYIDPFDPENNIYSEPKDVYGPSPYKARIYSSYDPNDKLVAGGNVMEINETDIARKWLTYTIRFENTGNFSAKDVFILDELEEDILPDSFTLLETSDAVEVDFLPSGENLKTTLRFSFNDIFLPFDDENNDGWVKFRVRVKEDIAENTLVENTARIYFDQNPPIITNTIQNLFRTPEVVVDTEAPNVVCQNIYGGTR